MLLMAPVVWVWELPVACKVKIKDVVGSLTGTTSHLVSVDQFSSPVVKASGTVYVYVSAWAGTVPKSAARAVASGNDSRMADKERGFMFVLVLAKLGCGTKQEFRVAIKPIGNNR